MSAATENASEAVMMVGPSTLQVYDHVRIGDTGRDITVLCDEQKGKSIGIDRSLYLLHLNHQIGRDMQCRHSQSHSSP